QLYLPVVGRRMPDRAEDRSQCIVGYGRGYRLPCRRIETWICIQLRLGQPHHRVVEKIKGFKPELEVEPFSDLRILQRTEIEGHKFRSAQDASAGVSKYLCVRGQRERSDVPELVA